LAHSARSARPRLGPLSDFTRMASIWARLLRACYSTICTHIPRPFSCCHPHLSPSTRASSHTALPLYIRYPTVSLFGGAGLTANFGATPFQFPPARHEGVAGCDWMAVETQAREAPPWLEYLQRFKAEEACQRLLEGCSVFDV
jgi:hypothetical protein